eukprot:TRINITY_DN2055_c0_g1_i1.p1 TRINITY_DN2055_c0_g1~~TRINITY_DN2055_c0_g1_i1.p1  ORF type:complete len:237 (+),score=70.12 TRINITY_DN2055_c0_g1_i1:308-1018(+)
MVQWFCFKYCWYWCWRSKSEENDSDGEEEEERFFGGRSYYEHSDLKYSQWSLRSLFIKLWNLLSGNSNESASIQTHYTEEDFKYMVEDRLDSSRYFPASHSGIYSPQSSQMNEMNNLSHSASFAPALLHNELRYQPPLPTLRHSSLEDSNNSSLTERSGENVDNYLFESVLPPDRLSGSSLANSSLDSSSTYFGRESLYYSVMDPSTSFEDDSEQITVRVEQPKVNGDRRIDSHYE